MLTRLILSLFCFFSIFSWSGCSKIGYIIDQASGQFKMIVTARPLEDVLKDGHFSEAERLKLQEIVQYKDFFYQFFNKKKGDLYSSFYLHDEEAITYLVIASPKDRIAPLEHSFPLVGTFPYLGFFKLEKAKLFERELIDQGFETYLRKVYAYSTLGFFNDPILSTFFHYSTYSLAELVFHELFHTIWFDKKNVAYSEALASFFARSLLRIYFEQQRGDVTVIEYLSNVQKVDELNRFVAKEVRLLDYALREEGMTSKKKLVRNFLDHVNSECDRLKMKSCSFLEGEWNNGRLAAFMTYHSDLEQIERAFTKSNLSLLDFYLSLEKELMTR